MKKIAKLKRMLERVRKCHEAGHNFYNGKSIVETIKQLEFEIHMRESFGNKAREAFLAVFVVLMLAGCAKSDMEPRCLGVTQTFAATGAEIIHFHSVCGSELEAWKALPKYSKICEADPRVIETIVEPCKH